MCDSHRCYQTGICSHKKTVSRTQGLEEDVTVSNDCSWRSSNHSSWGNIDGSDRNTDGNVGSDRGKNHGDCIAPGTKNIWNKIKSAKNTKIYTKTADMQKHKNVKHAKGAKQRKSCKRRKGAKDAKKRKKTQKLQQVMHDTEKVRERQCRCSFAAKFCVKSK